jgi:hypothetical protein
VGALADGILGAARSPTPPATYAIIGAYLAVCQCLVATKRAGLRANLPTLLGMTAPCVLGFLAMAVAETHDAVVRQGIPLLVAAGRPGAGAR